MTGIQKIEFIVGLLMVIIGLIGFVVRKRKEPKLPPYALGVVGHVCHKCKRTYNRLLPGMSFFCKCGELNAMYIYAGPKRFDNPDYDWWERVPRKY